jgi:cobalt-zinc-cadmium efflux system membrane fusion protein
MLNCIVNKMHVLNAMLVITTTFTLLTTFSFSAFAINHSAETHSAENHGAEKHSTEETSTHQAGIIFSAEKMDLANIKVSPLIKKKYTRSIYAPGEIKANGYTSYIVSPRTESVIINRHAILGEHVIKGQPLVTLFSEAMAEAQANYRVAYSEWQRVKKLTKGTVSESQLVKSETNHDAAFGRLIAYGLTPDAISSINSISNTANIDKTNTAQPDNKFANLGQYTLVAQRAGAVLSDDFSQGQRVAAGEKIMVLADEENLWVEARISPNKILALPVGTVANIEFSGKLHPAKVIQEAHTIDPLTRTRSIRLLVENADDKLHSGMFVNVFFQLNTPKPMLAVPETALMRSADGDWTVFVEDHPGEFETVEVELGMALGKFREIIGLPENTSVVTEGAFFISSEMAKGGFDPHNH